MCVPTTRLHEVLILPPCTLLQLYCCTTVDDVHAAHSQKKYTYTNVQLVNLLLSARIRLDKNLGKSWERDDFVIPISSVG